MKLYIYKVKNEQKLKEWGSYLLSQKVLVIETLEEEDVVFESLHLATINNERYAIGTIHSDKEGGVKPSNKDREINVKHREVMKECLEPVVMGEELYAFFNM